MANFDDKVERIDELHDSAAPKDVAERIEAPDRASPNKDHFDSLINHGQNFNTPTHINTGAEKTSKAVQEVNSLQNRVQQVSEASPDQVIAQAQDVIKQMESAKTMLATPNLELKGSVQNLLKNKLSHIDESLKVTLNRAGMEYAPQETSPAYNLATPIEKFLGLLTHGQNQLEHLAQNVEMMQKNDIQLSPASMLAIQIKVGYIQQEIELFTNMLNKALESTKTIMNVQI